MSYARGFLLTAVLMGSVLASLLSSQQVAMAGGCSGVPDDISGLYDFSAACAWHDQCYSGAFGYYRSECDRIFYSRLHMYCDQEYGGSWEGLNRWGCHNAATLFAFAVYNLGGGNWSGPDDLNDGPQAPKKVCHQVPRAERGGPQYQACRRVEVRNHR